MNEEAVGNTLLGTYVENQCNRETAWCQGKALFYWFQKRFQLRSSAWNKTWKTWFLVRSPTQMLMWTVIEITRGIAHLVNKGLPTNLQSFPFWFWMDEAEQIWMWLYKQTVKCQRLLWRRAMVNVGICLLNGWSWFLWFLWIYQRI